ncbi:hypothetical protein [Dechloromonas denitrificans]|uniref:hypothetical protein n=1 Tax=Dechloromonas denitrificans TaxID=281362 RepID=UPI001CF92CD1|nr:hypothetical protein [Dechloromonas denitrificans]UCV02327.1 hypothetical protein KI611_14675 [Dechloromonas denitrificans]
MARTHTPQQQYKEAVIIAVEHGMFVVTKGGRHTLFRKTDVRPVWLGSRVDAAALRSLVCRCAGVK